MKQWSEHRRANHERWLVSYADFITLLFAFFVVLYSFARTSEMKQAEVSSAITTALNTMGLQNREADTRNMLDQAVSGRAANIVSRPNREAVELTLDNQLQGELDGLRRSLEKDLASQLSAHILAIHMTPDGLVISLREAGYFDSASAVPKPGTDRTLHEIASSLDRTTFIIRAEGHTDSLAIHNSVFDSNWELSAARATRIARMLVEEDGVSPDRISAAGFAGYHPTATNSTPDGRAENRRVDLVIMPRVRFNNARQNLPSIDSWRRVVEN